MLVDTAQALSYSAPFATAAVSGLSATNAYQISDIIRIAVSVVVLGSGMLCVFYILWGGVMLILSGGKEDKIKPAISSIRFSVIGLIVIIVALFVLPRLGDLLSLHVSQYISPGAIFSTIKDLAARLFGAPSDVGGISIPGTSQALPSDFSDL